MAKDPVCGMEVEEKGAEFMVHLHHETYYFCGEACHERFEIERGLKGEPGKKWWQKILKEPKEKPPKCH